MPLQENQSNSSITRRIISTLDAIPETELAAFVDTIPVRFLAEYYDIMVYLYIDNYQYPPRYYSFEIVSIFKYLLNETALPETFSERRKLQLAALKKLVERSSVLRELAQSEITSHHIFNPAGGRRRTRKQKRSSNRLRRNRN